MIGAVARDTCGQQSRNGPAKGTQYSDEFEQPALRHPIGKIADLEYEIGTQGGGKSAAGARDLHAADRRRQRVVGDGDEHKKPAPVLETARQGSARMRDA